MKYGGEEESRNTSQYQTKLDGTRHEGFGNHLQKRGADSEDKPIAESKEHPQWSMSALRRTRMEGDMGKTVQNKTAAVGPGNDERTLTRRFA